MHPELQDWLRLKLFAVTVRSNGITDREKIIFELIMHFIADTDTDENYFGIIFS